MYSLIYSASTFYEKEILRITLCTHLLLVYGKNMLIKGIYNFIIKISIFFIKWLKNSLDKWLKINKRRY